MSDDPEQDEATSITRLLGRLTHGDPRAAEELLPLIYAQLHRMARREMRGQRADHTLGATALVNEAYLKLFQGEGQDWRDRDHFLALAARAMRQILVDHARGKNREKRKPSGRPVPLDEILESYEKKDVDVVALDDALEKLGEMDPLMVKVVELRYFGGFQVKEVARILDVSVRKVEREWQTARTWLRKEMA